MNTYELAYGNDALTFQLPESCSQACLTGAFPGAPTPEEERETVIEALRSPIGSVPLAQLAGGKQNVVVMVSDITRPVPSYKLLPALIDELEAAGVDDGSITVMFGLGTHRAHTEAEKRRLVGDAIYERVRCIDSAESEFVYLATSSRGTQYRVAAPVLSADLVIGTGNIEYHWFAGYSGGIKALVPGACDAATINANHSHLIDPNARTGNMTGNPVRDDMEELSQHLRLDFILNVVVDDHKRILASFAGHCVDAHRAGCAYLDSIYLKKIDRKADIVIASAGGYPKDINVYQAQKAVDNAAYAVRDGGTLVLIAQCAEGLGSDTLWRWVKDGPTREQVFSSIRREFQVGGHKAAGFAKVTQRCRLVIVSDKLERDVAARLWCDCCDPDELQHLLDGLVAQYGEGASVLVIPQGGAIFPRADE